MSIKCCGIGEGHLYLGLASVKRRNDMYRRWCFLTGLPLGGYATLFVALIGILLLPAMLLPSLASAISGVGGGSAGFGVGRPSGDAESSRFPIQVKLEGFLHYKPQFSTQKVLDVVSLRVAKYGETFPFQLVNISAVDLPRITQRQLLRLVKKWQVNFDIVGTSELLSEVAQALPGTPMTIVGYLTPRYRRFQLSRVDGFGFDESASVEQAQLLIKPVADSPREAEPIKEENLESAIFPIDDSDSQSGYEEP